MYLAYLSKMSVKKKLLKHKGIKESWNIRKKEKVQDMGVEKQNL